MKALESLLVEKGVVDPATLDHMIETYETKIGPRNGARVVARAWLQARRFCDCAQPHSPGSHSNAPVCARAAWSIVITASSSSPMEQEKRRQHCYSVRFTARDL